MGVVSADATMVASNCQVEQMWPIPCDIIRAGL